MARKLFALLTLGVWLASYIACFSCTDHAANQLGESVISMPAAEDHSNSAQENPRQSIPDACHCVCGLGTFAFAADSFQILADLPTLPLFAFDSDLAEQTRTDSVFRPPQA